MTSAKDPAPGGEPAGRHAVEEATGPEPEVDFRVLGPLEILVDGRSQAMPGGKPKGLLAVLLINRNRVVPSESIANAIWDGEPPSGYPAILQVYVSTLRRSLRTARADKQAVVATQAPGYRLLVDDAGSIWAGSPGEWRPATSCSVAVASPRPPPPCGWRWPNGPARPWRICVVCASPTISRSPSRRNTWSHYRPGSRRTWRAAWILPLSASSPP